MQSAEALPPPKTATDFASPLVPLNARQCAAVWNVRMHEYVAPCLNEIKKQLFSGTRILMYVQGNVVEPNERGSVMLQRDFHPLSHDIFLHLISFGIVPVAFRWVPDCGVGERSWAPYVPDPGQFVIRVMHDHGFPQYFFFWVLPTGDTEEDQSVIIFADQGANPTITGALTSQLASVVRALALADNLRDNAMRAENIRANPGIVQMYRPVDDPNEKNKAYTHSYLTSDPRQCQERAMRVRERSQQQKHEFAKHLQQYEEANPGFSVEDEFGIRIHNKAPRPSTDNVGGLASRPQQEQTWHNQYWLEPDRQPVNIQLPQVRTDLVHLINNARETVCDILSVPPGLTRGSSNVRAGVYAQHVDMFRTVNDWANRINRIMTAVYHHMHGKDNLKRELRARYVPPTSRKRPIGPPILHLEDVEQVARQVRVELRLDVIPPVAGDELRMLRDEQYISPQNAAKELLRVNHLSTDLLHQTKRPRLDPTQRPSKGSEQSRIFSADSLTPE